MDYDDYRGDLHIHIKKGRQLLDGRKSLDYVRFRHDKLGDLGRIERQHEFLSALKKRGVRFNHVGKIDDIAEIVAESVNLNPLMDIRDLAAILIFFTKLEDDDLRFHSAPVAMDVLYNDLLSLTPSYTRLDKLMQDILKVDRLEKGELEDEAGPSDAPEPVPADFEDV
jgi:anionic cell wall polymer biosynthesis LytR-Cps2A-Psr (LCP) family protein